MAATSAASRSHLIAVLGLDGDHNSVGPHKKGAALTVGLDAADAVSVADIWLRDDECASAGLAAKRTLRLAHAQKGRVWKSAHALHILNCPSGRGLG